MPQLTAVIVSKNRDVNAQFCIESIGCGDYVPNVILVDFGSKKNLNYLEKKYKFLKVIRVDRNTKEFHKARAINIGIKNVKTKFMCITDIDQIFDKNFFSVVESTLLENPKQLVMCKTYFLKTIPKIITSCDVGKKFPVLLGLAKNSGIKFHGDGCCNGILTKLAMKIGGYDETYIGYGGEDSDFALRANLCKFKTTWIHSKTNLVHLPHPKKGKYYSKSVFLKNKVRYKKKVKTKSIVANIGKSWGEL